MGHGSIEDSGHLQLQISRFIDFVESDHSVIPTDFRLCRFLGAPMQALSGLDGFEAARRTLDAYREDWLLRRLEENPKLAGIYSSWLKNDSGGARELCLRISAGEAPFD